MSPLEKHIVEAVRLLPGANRQQLPDLIPDFSPGAVMVAASKLAKRGVLKVEPRALSRGARPTHHYTINDNDNVKPKPKPVVESVSAELEELRAFKAMVLAKHPELAIPASTRRAREIVTLYVDADFARQVNAGNKDECPIMKATIHALEENW